MRRVLPVLCGLFAIGLVSAHPLGNNTVNRQAALQVSPTAFGVRYLIDLAEIPTLVAAAEADTNNDGTTSADEWQGYAQRYGAQVRDGLDVAVDGDPVSLHLQRTQWALVPGAAGLNTLRIEARLSATLAPRGAIKIDYRDQRRPDEAGWKEVSLSVARGLRIDASNVPQVSMSRDLTVYPAVGSDVANVLAASAQLIAVPLGLAGAVSRHDAAAVSRQQTVRVTPAPRAEKSVAQRPAVTQQNPQHAAIQPAQPAGHGALPAAAFFRLGVHHIATGWDHLLFLFGLVVAQASLRRLAWTITAFTAAHSLTLGLAASGLVAAPGAWVEPAIALTIAYVGLANLLGYHRHGAALAFAFGLVHGFGFAGALAASMGSLNTGGAWLLNLAAFNLGIEAFQLGLILLLVPLLRLSLRFAWYTTARNAASLGVMGAGIGWFLSRV
jgi:hypothetical protein